MEYCVFVEPHEGTTWSELAAFARATERLGFHGFFRSDHYLPPDGLVRRSPAVTDAWTTLAGLALVTERVRLGTLVTPVTFRLPGPLAVQVANVDAMSGGRVELGLGAGWNAREHEAYGIPFPERRFGMLEEQLDILRGLWSIGPDETFSFEGKHYRLDAVPGVQRPVGDVPIIMGGGGSRRTPELAARHAREFNGAFAPDDVLAARFARVRAACERVGRDPSTLRLSIALTTTVGATDAEAVRRADEVGQSEQDRLSQGIWGAPARVADRVAGLAALGADRIYFQLLDVRDLEQLDVLAEAVLA